MGKSSTFDNDVLKLIFNATPIANIADNAGTSPLTVLYVALHTADPTAAGNQSSSEISYTGYARVSVNRTTGAGGWTVTTNSVSPTSDIVFTTSTGGVGGTATFASVGIASAGATKILYSGALSPTVTVSNGIQPKVLAGSTITES